MFFSRHRRLAEGAPQCTTFAIQISLQKEKKSMPTRRMSIHLCSLAHSSVLCDSEIIASIRCLTIYSFLVTLSLSSFILSCSYKFSLQAIILPLAGSWERGLASILFTTSVASPPHSTTHPFTCSPAQKPHLHSYSPKH